MNNEESMKEITEEDIKTVRNDYIERFGIKKYLQQRENGCSENDLALELLELLKSKEGSRTLNVKLIGIDNWDRPVYKSKDGTLYKDISLGKEDLNNSLCTVCKNDFYGEPDIPIKNCIVKVAESEQEEKSNIKKQRDIR